MGGGDLGTSRRLRMCGSPQAGTMAETEEGIMIDHTNEATDRVRYVPADTDDLRARPADNADGEGRADVAYREIDSPIGRLLLAATPAGLAYVAFEVEDRAAVLDMLATRIGSRVRRVPDPAPALPSTRPQPSSGSTSRAVAAASTCPSTPAWPSASGARSSVTSSRSPTGRPPAPTRQLATELDRPGAVRAVGARVRHQPAAPGVAVPPDPALRRRPGRVPGRRGGEAAAPRRWNRRRDRDQCGGAVRGLGGGVISPGPDVVVVLQRSLSGRRHGVATAAGIVAGISVWLAAAFAGLAALVRVYPQVMTVMQVAGGLLLATLGALGLRGWWRARAAGQP